MKPTPSQLSAISQECACLGARSAARVLTKFYDSCLASSGLKVTQFSILVTIAAHGAIAITKLADALELDRTTLTRNLSVLERKGLVQISTGADIRSKEVRLSPQGIAAIQEALPLWKKAQGVVRSNVDYDALMEQFRNIQQKEKMFV